MPDYDLSALTPTQAAVYLILAGRPYDGACRRDFALEYEIYEVSNRIGEVERRLGITIERARCRKHAHRRPVTLYRL